MELGAGAPVLPIAIALLMRAGMMVVASVHTVQFAERGSAACWSHHVIVVCVCRQVETGIERELRPVHESSR